MERGERFEPILLGNVGTEGPFVLDGFHRVEAARRAGVKNLDARVATMSEETATLVAIEANAQHALNLSRKDRRRCFRMFCAVGRHLKADGSVKPLRQLRTELGNIAVASTISRWLAEDSIVPSDDDGDDAVLPWRDEDEQGPDLDEFDVQLYGLENTFHRLTDGDRVEAAKRLHELAVRLFDGERRDGLMFLDV